MVEDRIDDPPVANTHPMQTLFKLLDADRPRISLKRCNGCIDSQEHLAGRAIEFAFRLGMENDFVGHNPYRRLRSVLDVV